jgi:TPR repeat protein
VQWQQAKINGDTEYTKTNLPQILELAEYGDVFSQSVLCEEYYTGRIIKKDNAEAAYWCELTVNNDGRLARNTGKIGGGIDAENQLQQSGIRYGSLVMGHLYMSDEDVEKDASKAMQWYRKSAEAGGAHAAFELADIYYLGELGEKDLVLAYAWIIQAEKLGYEDGILKEAYNILGDEIDDNDLAKAIELGARMVKHMPEQSVQ